MSGDLLSALASLPDEALVPVGWVRERLAETSIGHPAPESSAVGDGYDDEELLKVGDVAKKLALSPNQVYELPIPRVRVGKRSIRWRPQDVYDFIQRRSESL